VASIWQITWNWTGFVGSGGYTNLYYLSSVGDATEALAAATKSRILFDDMKGFLPNNVNIRLVSDVRLIEDSTGDLRNIFTVVGPASVQGIAGVGGYPAPVGGCIDWLTGVVHGKHLMVGRTFFVPLYGGAYEDNGSLTGGAVVGLGSAAEAMRTAAGPTFGVWGRPRKATTTPPPGRPALGGMWQPAISSRVPDKAVVLRSRRD
jgi:hypothetical protein